MRYKLFYNGFFFDATKEIILTFVLQYFTFFPREKRIFRTIHFVLPFLMELEMKRRFRPKIKESRKSQFILALVFKTELLQNQEKFYFLCLFLWFYIPYLYIQCIFNLNGSG